MVKRLVGGKSLLESVDASSPRRNFRSELLPFGAAEHAIGASGEDNALVDLIHFRIDDTRTDSSHHTLLNFGFFALKRVLDFRVRAVTLLPERRQSHRAHLRHALVGI